MRETDKERKKGKRARGTWKDVKFRKHTESKNTKALSDPAHHPQNSRGYLCYFHHETRFTRKQQTNEEKKTTLYFSSRAHTCILRYVNRKIAKLIKKKATKNEQNRVWNGVEDKVRSS